MVHPRATIQRRGGKWENLRGFLPSDGGVPKSVAALPPILDPFMLYTPRFSLASGTGLRIVGPDAISDSERSIRARNSVLWQKNGATN